MTFATEIMLRHDARVFTETIDHPVDAESWTDADVEVVLMQVLRAIDRRLDPDGSTGRVMALRGLTWIVHPTAGGNVLAIEIHSASAVAGPFAIPADRLEGMITRVLTGATSSHVVH